MSRTESYTMRSGTRCGMAAPTRSFRAHAQRETDTSGGHASDVKRETEVIHLSVERAGDAHAHHRSSPDLGSCTAAAGGASATPTTATGRLFSGTATAIGKGTAF